MVLRIFTKSLRQPFGTFLIYVGILFHRYHPFIEVKKTLLRAKRRPQFPSQLIIPAAKMSFLGSWRLSFKSGGSASR